MYAVCMISPSASRRTFLGASAAALTFPRIGFTATAPEGGGFQLGVASYSLRKFPRAQAIDMIKQLGVKYVNIKDFHLAMNSTPDEV